MLGRNLIWSANGFSNALISARGVVVVISWERDRRRADARVDEVVCERIVVKQKVAGLADVDLGDRNLIYRRS